MKLDKVMLDFSYHLVLTLQAISTKCVFQTQAKKQIQIATKALLFLNWKLIWPNPLLPLPKHLTQTSK